MSLRPFVRRAPLGRRGAGLDPGLGVVGARVEQRRCPADEFRVEWAWTTGFLGSGAGRDG